MFGLPGLFSMQKVFCILRSKASKILLLVEVVAVAVQTIRLTSVDNDLSFPRLPYQVRKEAFCPAIPLQTQSDKN